MPRGILSAALQQSLSEWLGVGAEPVAGPLHGAGFGCHSDVAHHGGSGAFATLTSPPVLRRHGRRFGGFTAFDDDGMQDGDGDDDDDGPDTEDPNGPDATEPPDSAGAKGAGKGGGAGRPAGDGQGSGDAIEWENTEGLPKVTVSKASSVYVSKDIADKPGESAFNPTLGCKCGNWESAPAHPTIDFRKSFLADHEDFIRRVRKLKVHMEDTTTPKPVVHWDAVYDLKRFLSPDKLAELRLPEAMPAIPHSGTQLNFLTFCPPEGRGSHQYSLSVTALDEQDNPISYFNNETSNYQAAPPAPEAKVQLPFAAKGGGAQKGPPAQGLTEVARATLK